jgi:hypothetical protein
MSSTLAGHLIATPGKGLPAIQSHRRALAPLLVRGRDAHAVPDLLAAVFSLCGGAHRLTAQAAIDAARGHVPAHPSRATALALQVDTVREHLRRLWLDWPRALDAHADGPSGAAPALGIEPPAPIAQPVATLTSCPLLTSPVAASDPATAAPVLAATNEWVAQHVFGLPVATWLAEWVADPVRWMIQWVESATTSMARRLRGCRSVASALAGRPTPLSVHASPQELQRLADHLAHDDGFALHPVWRGRCAETGPWTRLNDRLASPDEGGHHPLDNAWLRLGSRLADLARLLLPDHPLQTGAGWLRQGALALKPGVGVAFCEMARGLLIHWVRLDDTSRDRVADCRVLAPTEWNFHPHGPVAQALATLPPQVQASTVRVLAAAFDPCVELQVRRGPAGDANAASAGDQHA